MRGFLAFKGRVRHPCCRASSSASASVITLSRARAADRSTRPRWRRPRFGSPGEVDSAGMTSGDRAVLSSQPGRHAVEAAHAGHGRSPSIPLPTLETSLFVSDDQPALHRVFGAGKTLQHEGCRAGSLS